MQLVAYGAQDIYLTGNPQITFFKVVYRRHTNFSMEEIAQEATGSVRFGGETTYTISRNGDLIHKMYFEFSPSIFDGTGSSKVCSSYLGHGLLKEINCEIGGQTIDKHYSHWLTTWADLTEINNTGKVGKMTVKGEPYACGGGAGDDSEMGLTSSLYMNTSFNHLGIDSVTAPTMNIPSKAYVPLRFWFNRNPGLALPLIALQYHEVKIITKFEEYSNLLGHTSTTNDIDNKVKFYVQYIFLDTDERRRFSQVSHEYLIEQLQFQKESANNIVTLNFNHPVKELIWTGAPTTTPTNSTTGPHLPATLEDNTTSEANNFILKLNGHDRFEKRNSRHFTRQQIYDHHTGYGGIIVPDSIAVYSFALKPEEHQPSGTCNFSRIDTAQLEQTSTTIALHIYAINYNVLRIMSGMGGLAYSN